MTRFLGRFLWAASALAAGATGALLGLCGNFTDVNDANFCPFVLEIFDLAITTGTTPTTYSPNDDVTRLQMAAFLSRTVDRALDRSSRRAALRRFWTAQNAGVVGLTTVGAGPEAAAFDGADVWVANTSASTVARVASGSGKLLEVWPGAASPSSVLIAMGRVFVTGLLTPNGSLYAIDPTQAPGSAGGIASNLGGFPREMAFDGGRIWTANFDGSVSIVTPGTSLPWTVTTVTAGFTSPFGALYDGASVWVTDANAARLRKLDANGAILQSVTVGGGPGFPIFDGTNIWVPNSLDSSVSVARAASGAVLATLTGNGLNIPLGAIFDGERVFVANEGGSVSLFKAADFTPLGSVSIGGATAPFGGCADGVSVWIVLNNAGSIARF